MGLASGRKCGGPPRLVLRADAAINSPLYGNAFAAERRLEFSSNYGGVTLLHRKSAEYCAPSCQP
jgi:hypothetical protein